eukprot:GEMP01057129.1.p2 GENE.GEMP01057129.1~~GEMP01057129.1.p2  ORF type:complete len:107 (+),score=21.90 GEMP01057129.1:458-778(+)
MLGYLDLCLDCNIPVHKRDVEARIDAYRQYAGATLKGGAGALTEIIGLRENENNDNSDSIQESVSIEVWHGADLLFSAPTRDEVRTWVCENVNKNMIGNLAVRQKG